jgi:hypothetical protein
MKAVVQTSFVLIGLIGSTVAQEIAIPDPELNAAIRAALHKPTGPLTQQDMLSLTNLARAAATRGESIRRRLAVWFR